MRVSWRRALLFSGGAAIGLFALDIGVRASAMGWLPAVAAASLWLQIWPIFFLMILLLGNLRAVSTFLHGTEVRAIATLGSVEVSPEAATLCPRCGHPNPQNAIKCSRCPLRFRTVIHDHPLDLLPGAKRSIPAILYFLSFFVALAVGLVPVMVLAFFDHRFIDNDALMVGSYLVGSFASLIGTIELMRWLTTRKSSSTVRKFRRV